MAVSYPKELSKCSNEEIYLALLEHVKKLAAQKAGKDTTEKEKKKLYYIQNRGVRINYIIFLQSF